MAIALRTDEERIPITSKHGVEKIKFTWYLLNITFLSAIGGFLFGYDTGIVSGALLFIRDYFDLTDFWQELVVSITIFGALVFSSVSGYVTDNWGRKPVILLSSIVFTIGSVLMGLSTDKYMLLGGRLVAGIAIGLSSMPIPLYIAEMSPPQVRGRLVTLNNCFITGGQFVAAVISCIFSKYRENGWRYMLGIAAIPSSIQFLGLLFMPESPRWLFKRGRHQDALKVLYKIRGPGPETDEEFESIKEAAMEQERENAERGGASVFESVLHGGGLRKALLLGCVIQLTQQLAGINTLMYYSAAIIQMAGVHSTSDAVYWAAVTAAANFFCTLIGLCLVERIGRRLLTLISLGGVVFSLCFLAIGFQLSANEISPVTYQHNSTISTLCAYMSSCQSCNRVKSCGFCFSSVSNTSMCLVADDEDHSRSHGGPCMNGTADGYLWAWDWCPSTKAWMIVLGLVLYLFAFAPGMGPMPWAINSEIYPMWARSTCFSISTTVNWGANLAVSLSFLSLADAITEHGAFWLYASFAFVGWLLIYLMLPETKGKTLEEIQSLFESDLTSLTLNGHSNHVDYLHIRGTTRQRTAKESRQNEPNK